MKRILYIISLVTLTLGICSCEIDNFEGPDAGISGRVLDHNEKPLQTEQGSGNFRIKIEELSWITADSSRTINPRYLNMKLDGSYVNTKLFAGQYRMTPVEGPFYPYDVAGEVVDLKGNTTKDFTVTSYLDVEWVEAPALTSDNFIKATIKFKRNAKDGMAKPDLLNMRFFISTNQYAGNNNYDGQLFVGQTTVTNAQEGTTLQLISSRAVKYTKTTYYVRAGVCCNDTYKKYNYTDIKTVTVP